MSTNLAAVYIKAADVIRTNGHAKGAFYRIPESGVGIEYTPAEYPVCAVGAIGIALFGHPSEWLFKEMHVALGLLYQSLDGRGSDDAHDLFVAQWNDAPERTADDVIAALESAAKAVA